MIASTHLPELIVDSFAGGGGASEGIRLALGRDPDIAINHDAEAIALHAANHPGTRHFREDVWKVDPVEACGGRAVGLMWLSPDCKHFSKAKGGKPVSKRVRGLAWVAVRWAVAVKPRVIVLENVEEFQTWGPVLRETGRPCPVRKGVTFRRFVGKLRRLGYVVEWRELRACDYGAPTSRKRLFLIARCDGKPIVWPKPTHGKGRAHPWRTAAECIDWSLPCPSIFLSREEAKKLGVKRPLAEATMRRIARGVQRYVIDAAEPFIVGLGGRMGQSPERSVERPYQTITAKADAAVVQPFIVPVTHQGDDRAHGITEPVRTVTGAQRGEMAMVEPFLVPMQHDNRPTSPTDPLQTITTQGNKFNLIAPYLVPRYGERDGQEPRTLRADRPLPTIVPTQNGAQLALAFMAQHNTDVIGHAMHEPVSTIVGKGCTQGLVTAHIKRDFGQSVGSAMDEPMRTITADGNGHASLVTSHLAMLNQNSIGQSPTEPMHTVMAGATRFAEVRAFLVKYYGTEQRPSLFAPLPTVTSRDRFGLVTVHGTEYVIVDIGMRMLTPRELYRAQGFSDAYQIDIPFKGRPLTKTAQVRMVGNSVCPPLAAAIVGANCPELALEMAA